MVLQNSVSQLTLAAQYTAQTCELDNLVDAHGQLNPHGEVFADKNEPVVYKMLNTLIQTTQSQLGDVAVNWLLTNKRKELPPASEIEKILRRDVDLNKELFDWWWTDYIPKACGAADIWSDQRKYFGMLSIHGLVADPNNVFVSASTEAWAGLVMENCRSRWPAVMHLRSEGNLGRSQYHTKLVEHPIKDVIYINLTEHTDYQGKYMDPDSGQVPFGGWSFEGLLKFATWL